MSDLDLVGLYWSNQLAKCETDLAHLMRSYLRIRGKGEIGTIPVTPNRVQAYLIEKFRQQQEEIGKVRYVIGKSRQVTCTTVCRALAFQQTAFADDRAAIMVAHDEDTSHAVFGTDRFFYEHLPPEIRPKRAKDTMADMAFPARRSLSLSRHAANLNVGAASAYHVMHLTEASRFTKARQIQGSLFPTLSDAKGSIGIIESTSVWGGTWYYNFADAAMKGDNGPWRFVFIPFYWNAEHTAPVPQGFTPTVEEQSLLKRCGRDGLTKAHLAWRRIKRMEYKMFPALVQSEFPMNWDESWAMPEGATRVFKEDALVALKAGLRPAKWMTATADGLRPAIGISNLSVWAAPEPDVFYHMGVDPSGGDTSEDKDPDWSVACVIRRDTLEQVAEFRVQMNPASQDFIDAIYWLGVAYNTAEINPDLSGGWGAALLTELQRRGYHNLWHWRRRDDAKERETQKVGFIANRRDKSILVYLAAGVVERGEAEIHSETLWDEMVNYMATGLEEWAGREKDDAVFAWMLAVMAARDSSEGVSMPRITTPKTEAEKVAEQIEREPWKYHDIVNDLADTHPVLVNLEPWR